LADDFLYSTGIYRTHWQNAGTIGYTASAPGNNSQAGLINYAIAAVGAKGGLMSTPIGFPAPALLLFGANVILTALSDGTNRYQVQAGIFDNTLNSVLGFGFRYQDNINGGKWLCFGNADTFDSGEGVTLSVNKLRVFGYGPSSPVIFMVNDRTVGTILAPAVPAAGVAAVTIEKTVGVTSRTMRIDYCGVYWTRPDLSF
jgi:hypothetical protein